MATLVFRVSAQYDEVIKLRNEISKLEAQLKKMDVNKSPAAAKALETQLASARQQMMGLVTEAAKVGIAMENDLKRKINNATKASDELSEEIIKQRKIIRETQEDVRQLSEQYSKLGKYSPQATSKLNQLNRAKAALNEQRYALGELQDQQARNRLEVRQLAREYKEFSQGTDKATVTVDALMSSLKRTALEIGGLAAIKKFSSDVINATGKMQQLQVALSTILQSKSKADTLLADISQFALKTPFSIDDVATGAKQLLAYGSSANTVVNELSMLGDVASGLQIPLGQLIYLYGTLRTQGRAMTVDIRQFAGRGIPIYEELAKVLGVSQEQVGELVKQGKVGFKEVEQAFKNMTSEGGKFNNMLENSAGTWTQQIAAVQEKLFLKMNEFGNKYKEVFEFGIGTAEDLVESLDDVLSIMGGLIAAYGTYKAALVTAAVAQKAVGFVESIQLIGMYRKELGLATAAQQAFNVASKSNMYVTLLAALVGIGTAVYMFTKRSNEATVAQETLNSVNKKADEEFSKQAATVDRLSGVLKSETSSLDRKKKALSDLQTIIPSYNASLDEEGRLINNNTEAIKSYLTQLEKQIRMKAAQEELEELYRKKRTQEKQQKVATENYNEAKSLYNSSVTMTGSALQNRGVNTGVAVFSQNSAVNDQLKDSANKAKKELDSVNKELGETVSAIKELEKEIEKSSLSDKKEAQHSTISEEVENATIRIKTLKQEIADLRSGKLQAEAGKTVESAIKAKEKELQSAEKTLETLTGVSHKSENKKVVDNQQNLSDELLQLIRANQQEEINLMEEGSEKKRRQIELDYQREIDEIRKQRKKWEDAQGGKLTSEQREVLGSRASNAMQSREKGLAEITKAENQAAIEANERYLKSYGTFMQKRDAIIAEYTRKISEAATQGDKDILQKEMDKALSSLDLEKLKHGINWELIFGDLDKVSKESLNKVKQQLRDFKNSEEYKNMAVDQKKVIDEALSNIQSTLIDKGGLLADLPEQLSELAKAQEELSQAQEEYNEAMRSGTDAQKEAATKKLNDAQKRQQNAQVNVQKSTDKTTSNLVTLSNVITQLGSNSEISLSQVGDLAGNIVDIFAEESEKLGGIIGAAFSLLDAIGTQGLDGFIGNIFSSVFKSVGGIWDTLTFGGFSKLFGIGGNEKEVQDTINRLTDRNEKLQSAIESLTEEMKSSKGSEKSVAEYNKAIKYQEEYNKNVLSKAQANAGYHSKHHSWAYYMGWSESDIQWIRENVMAEFTGTDSLWQMSPEQMDLLRQNVDLWQKMADSGKGGYGNAVVDALGEYADLAGNLEELKEGLFEQLTGISFDSMYDSFIDTLMDMDASAEDFADNLSEYFMRAMLSDKIGNMYSQKLEDWWNRFGESMKDGNLSESERNSLQNEYMGYVNEALKLRDELAAATGYDKAGSSSQQSASSRGFGTEMTHEDAGELSGRFTAVYESNLRIETAEQQQTVAITELRGSIGSLTSQVTGLYNIADETRTILANSYLELQQIRENTGEIVKPIKQMQADIAEVKRNTARL